MTPDGADPTGPNSRRILIADDKVAGRELVRVILEHESYEVVEACDGIEAVAAANRMHFDLLILDLHMPGLDGFGVIRELRGNPALLHTPVIALTASAMRGDLQRALDAGFTSYVTKPVSLKVLRNEVERLLAGVPR